MGYTLLFSGLIFGIFFILALRRSKASKSWPSTEGTITGMSMEESYDDEGDLNGYFPRVHYIYTVDGEEFANENYGLSDKVMTRTAAQQFLSAFHEGERVMVYYNPKMPGDAVLTTQSGVTLYIMLGVCVVLAVIGLYLVLSG